LSQADRHKPVAAVAVPGRAQRQVGFFPCGLADPCAVGLACCVLLPACPASCVQVKVAATEAGVATFKLVGNRDIEHILDDLLHCVARPNEVSGVVTKLSATTFVQVGRDAQTGRQQEPAAAPAGPQQQDRSSSSGGGSRLRHSRLQQRTTACDSSALNCTVKAGAVVSQCVLQPPSRPVCAVGVPVLLLSAVLWCCRLLRLLPWL
jgi:hypothetical protein